MSAPAGPMARARPRLDNTAWLVGLLIILTACAIAAFGLFRSHHQTRRGTVRIEYDGVEKQVPYDCRRAVSDDNAWMYYYYRDGQLLVVDHPHPLPRPRGKVVAEPRRSFSSVVGIPRAWVGRGMEHTSPKELARRLVALGTSGQQLVHDQVEEIGNRVDARIHPRPKHRVRNVLLSVAGLATLVTVALGLVGRRKSVAPSPVQQAGAAATDRRNEREAAAADDGLSSQVGDVLAAGASAVKSGAGALQDDVALGATTAKDAPVEAVHEKVEATKEQIAAVKENVTGKLMRVGIFAVAGLTVYILVMAVLVTLIVDWIA